MDISFTPAPDVSVILNALLDKFENRAKRNPALREVNEMKYAPRPAQPSSRSVKIFLDDLELPFYFSQIDPQSRIIANQQLHMLEQYGLLHLNWLPGETNHLLRSVSLPMEPETRNNELFHLLSREPIADNRARLESSILAEKFRYQKDDWRVCALDYTLNQLRAGKSPSPFSLTDSDFNHGLLLVLQALSTLTAETPYRVFSVRVFNDTKRFDDLKSALIRLARRANAEWKSLNNEDLLSELNLVANPGYIHLAGNWELTDTSGQIINLDSFVSSVGFPAAQIESIRKVTIRAEFVLCIENLTSFHEFTRTNGTRAIHYATLCLMGNPSPSIRHLLRLIPEEAPIRLWSDMDYGGFNILAQLRKQISPRIQPYLMDINAFENHAHLSRPLTPSDTRNLNRLIQNPILKDIHPTIEYLLERGLKLEQEAIPN